MGFDFKRLLGLGQADEGVMGARGGRADIASKPVEDFQVTLTPDAAPHERTSRIFGEPIHTTRKITLRDYRSRELDTHLAEEARHGIGNYVLVDTGPEFCRVITSPGYCGGYYCAKDGMFAAATLLAPVLKHVPGEIEMDPFGLSLFLSHAPRSNFNLMPFTTMFRDVRRIPPGSILEFQGGTLTGFRSYLCAPDPLEPPGTFNRAMVEVNQGVKAYFKRVRHMGAAVMFSGGVDSVAIYLGLRDVLGKKALQLFTMEHSASNGPERALPVAASMDVETRIVRNDVYEDGAIYDKIISWMDRDIPAFNSPHLVFLKWALPDTVIFHGQNADALANIHMEVLQETHEAGYLSTAGARVAKTENRRNRQHGAFLKNLQLTDAYLEDPYFQKLTVDFYANGRKGLEPDPKPGPQGILRGMLSSQFPNLLARSKLSFDQVAGLDREVSLFQAYIGAAADNPRMALDMMRFLTYSHLANKRATTFDLGENSRPLFLAMSGPITSYYLGRPRGLADASQPKREIYAYSRKLSGLPYRTMIQPKEGEPPVSSDPCGPDASQRLDGMLARVVGELDPEQSLLLSRTKDPQVLDHVAEIYGTCLEICKRSLTEDNHVRATAYQKQALLRIANLEKLLKTISKP